MLLPCSLEYFAFSVHVHTLRVVSHVRLHVCAFVERHICFISYKIKFMSQVCTRGKINLTRFVEWMSHACHGVTPVSRLGIQTTWQFLLNLMCDSS